MTVRQSDVDAAFAEVAERRAAEADHQRAWRMLWLAHHWPHRYERCTIVRGRHVCRRCLWFYSVSLLTLVAAWVGLSPWPQRWDSTLVWALSVPATVEFIGGELGRGRYDARRQVVVTSLLGLAVGRGFAAELADPGSWTFWGPVLVFGSLWFAVAAGAWIRNRGQYRENLAQ
jgi:hypothetical protein